MALPTYQNMGYVTDLTPAQIQQKLADNVLTGFSFMSNKAYYGSITPYDFSIRKRYNSIKNESINPSMDGTYKIVDKHTFVTINFMPHTALLVFLGLFTIPLVLFLLAGLQEFFKTWDMGILFTCFVPVAVLYGVFWLIFHFQCQAILRFWEYTLALKPI